MRNLSEVSFQYCPFGFSFWFVLICVEDLTTNTADNGLHLDCRAPIPNPTNAVGGSLILGLLKDWRMRFPNPTQRSWWIVHTQPTCATRARPVPNPTNAVGGSFILGLQNAAAAEPYCLPRFSSRMLATWSSSRSKKSPGLTSFTTTSASGLTGERLSSMINPESLPSHNR